MPPWWTRAWHLHAMLLVFGASAVHAQRSLSVEMGVGPTMRSVTPELPNACTPRTRILGGMVGVSHAVRGRVGVQGAWHGHATIDLGGDACIARDDVVFPGMPPYTRTRSVASDRWAPSSLVSLRATLDVLRSPDDTTVHLRVLAGPAYAPSRGTLLPSAGVELRAGRGALQFRAAVDYWRGTTRFVDERVTSVPTVTITTIGRRERVESLWALHVGLGVRRR
jgi:hypothetical protein